MNGGELAYRSGGALLCVWVQCYGVRMRFSIGIGVALRRIAVVLPLLVPASGSQRTLEATTLSHGVANAAAEVRRVQSELLAVKTRSMETDVPLPVQRSVTMLKAAMVALVDEAMLSLPPETAPSAAQRVLGSLLPAKSSHPALTAVQADGDAPMAGTYGEDLAVTVTSPARGLLLVDASFRIECGEDNLLLGYSNNSGSWRRILRWQAAPYDKISGAFGDLFETHLLTPQHEGKPVLLVVHGTPWCMSTMSRFAMDTFALGAGGGISMPFWHGEQGYRRADDVPPYAFAFKTTPDGFEIRASVNDWTDAIARVGVMRYRLTPSSVERTLPIAINSRETVEEWLGMPRDQAARFTDAAPGSLTWQMFDTFTYEGKPRGAVTPSMLYGPVRPCKDDPKHFQVEIDSRVYSPGNRSSSPGPAYYVQVHETGNGYLLHDTTGTPAMQCTGKPLQFGAGYGSLNQ